jgi:putative SOS response-associated peptidase YedK
VCGRFTLKTPVGDWLSELIGESVSFPRLDLRPRFNIAPTQLILIARRSETGQIEVKAVRWGLLPHWATDLKIGNSLINARSETVQEKPAFRDAFRNKRCLVLTDGYYEWKGRDKNRQPFWVHRPAERPFAFCGLWAENKKLQPEPLLSATIVTRASTGWMLELHDRTPLIPFHDSLSKNWMSHGAIDLVESGFTEPFPDDYLELRPVSNWVGNPRHDDERCLELLAQ